jgi:hypothetical protein
VGEGDGSEEVGRRRRGVGAASRRGRGGGDGGGGTSGILRGLCAARASTSARRLMGRHRRREPSAAPEAGLGPRLGGGGARWRGALRRWEVLGLYRLKIIARSFSCWKMRDLLQRASPPGVSADALLAIVRVCHGCCASSCVPGLCSKVSFLHDRFPDSDLVRRRRNFHGLRLV